MDGHNFPNIPLMKLSAYHKQNGDTVEWHMPIDSYDIIYMSKVFTFTPEPDYPINADTVIYGGTGYGVKNKLTYEVEHMCPDYSLYPQYSEAYGFLTRGCPRGCEFCVVSAKEGRKSVQAAGVNEFHRGQKVIKLLDPNLTACADREKLLIQLADTKAYVDFTQGLDIRLIDDDFVKLLNNVKMKKIYFAWDNPKDDLTDQFTKYNTLGRIKDKSKKRVFVLTNFESTHDEDLYRINTLKKLEYA